MKIFVLSLIVVLALIISSIVIFGYFRKTGNLQPEKMNKTNGRSSLAVILPRDGKKQIYKDIFLRRVLDKWILSGLPQPFGINFDKEGNFYLTDFKQHSITKISSDFSKVSYLTSKGWSSEIPTDVFFQKPHAIEFDKQDDIFIADYGNGEMKKFDRDGNYLFSIKGKLVGPVAATAGPNNILYIADYTGSKLYQYNIQTKDIKEFSGDFDRLGTAKFDSNSNMLVADTWNHRILKYDKQLNLIGAIGEKSNNEVTKNFERTDLKFVESKKDGGFFAPVAIAFDEQNNLYVSEAGEGSSMRVQVFTNDGVFIKTIGEFNAPYDIKIKDNYLFVAEPYLGQIQILDLEI